MALLMLFPILMITVLVSIITAVFTEPKHHNLSAELRASYVDSEELIAA